ncbi:MAG: mechanosensitive ion channel family protein [Flavobacteriales bacterium]|nr:mechanosensitive ion channel family protein [Flavobacteriales bacterium]
MPDIKAIFSKSETIIISVLIILGAILLMRFARWAITKAFESQSDNPKYDPTRYAFFKNAVSLIIWILAFAAMISLIPQFKSLAITLFAGAGILVAIIGFAAQAAFSNIINGIFIVIFRPFRVGDIIKVGSLDYGIVDDITLRHTVIVTYQNRRLIIPNSNIGSENIINDSIDDPKLCRFIEFGISYDSDVDRAMRIIQEECEAHPNCIDNRTPEEIEAGDPKVAVRLINFGDSSVNLRAWAWAESAPKSFLMHCDVNKSVKARFDSEGIEIPFPHRTLVFKNAVPEQ